MNISKLTQDQKDGVDIGKAVYGVIIDKLVDDTLNDIEEIGIIASLEDDGTSLSLDVLDTVLSYVAVGVNVILEVPYDLAIPEQDITILALNCGIDISILSPESKDKAEWDKYVDVLSTYTTLWLNQKNSKKMVYPVSGFLQYMIGEVFSYKPDFISNDPYLISNFVDKFDLETMDSTKEKLRVVIYESFGSKDKFEVFAHSLASALAKNIVSESQVVLEDSISEENSVESESNKTPEKTGGEEKKSDDLPSESSSSSGNSDSSGSSE